MIAIIFAICAIFIGTLGSPHSFEERIVGGTNCTLGEFPHLVSLRVLDSHICGASILDERHVLTAAHCVKGVYIKVLSIQYGLLDNKSLGNVIRLSQVIMHERYVHGGNYPNDIAILKLASSIKIDGINVRPVKLPVRDPSVSDDENKNALLAGWGYRDSDEPIIQRFCLRTDLPLWRHDICQRYLSNYDPLLHVCAGTLDGQHKQCSGDSGGPLTVVENGEHVQYGVVSFSIKPCSITERPGIFTNVYKYLAWIRRNW